MNKNGHLLSLQFDCETSIAMITSCLKAFEMGVVRTFDLRSACAPFIDNTCQHSHDAAQCDCQMVVLLVYGQDASPVSLVVHTHLSQSDIRLVRPPDADASSELETRINDALLTNDDAPANCIYDAL